MGKKGYFLNYTSYISKFILFENLLKYSHVVFYLMYSLKQNKFVIKYMKINFIKCNWGKHFNFAIKKKFRFTLLIKTFHFLIRLNITESLIYFRNIN